MKAAAVSVTAIKLRRGSRSLSPRCCPFFRTHIAGGYGGLFFEPIIMPKYPVHISVPVLVGVGGVAYAIYNDNHDYNDNFVEDSEVFLVLEPGIELEFNFTKFFRFAITGTYRLTSDITLENTPVDALRGFSGGVTFKFGKF